MVLCPVDEVLHDKEVVRKSHIADGHQLKLDSFLLLIVKLPVALAGSLVGQIAQIRHRGAEHIAAVIAVFVVAAVVYDFAVFILPTVDICHKILRNLKFRKDVAPVDGIAFHLVCYLEGIGDDFRMVREHRSHLLFALEILLLGIVKSVGVINKSVGSQADESVMHRTVLLSYEVDIVGGNHLHIVLASELEDGRDIAEFLVESLKAQSGHLGLVEHHLEVIIIPEHIFVPFYGLFRAFDVTGQNLFRNLSAHAG